MSNHMSTAFWVFMLIVVLSVSVADSRIADSYGRQPTNLSSRLAQPIRDFDNHGEPLISTLLRLAADYHLPMGIERVTAEGIRKPIEVKLQQGTVRTLIDSCVQKINGYAWKIEEGVVFVYGVDEYLQPSNLFNYVLPSFEIVNRTIGRANSMLREKLILEKYKPSGIAGSYIISPETENKTLNLNVHNIAIRQILNRLIALHGEVVWIARVPPDQLREAPSQGLWVMIPVSIFARPQTRSPAYLNSFLHLFPEPKPTPQD